jgi:hypothetical protein
MTALFADLQRRFPGRFADGQVRTLQRRLKQWRAEQGPPREVFFAQVHHPGRLCASDFTHCTDLRVTINGAPGSFGASAGTGGVGGGCMTAWGCSTATG